MQNFVRVAHLLRNPLAMPHLALNQQAGLIGWLMPLQPFHKRITVIFHGSFMGRNLSDSLEISHNDP